MAAICCVFHQPATQDVEIRLGKLAMCRITQIKKQKNRHSDTEHAFQSRITGSSIVFQRNKYVNLACFLNICKCIMVFLCFSTVKKIIIHTVPLNHTKSAKKVHCIKVVSHLHVGPIHAYVNMPFSHTHTHTHTHIHTHTHTCWFLWFTGTLHRRNGFYTVQTVCAIALHQPYT